MEVGMQTSSMPADRQIDGALKEGIGNIVLAVMGIDGLGFDEFEYSMVEETKNGAVTIYSVTAKVTDQIAQLTFLALVPVRHPDNESLLYRIDDVVFLVDAGIGGKYEVWCEHNPYNGAIAIVRSVDNGTVTWLVAGTLDDIIIHIAPFEKLGVQYQDIIRKHWPGCSVK